MKTDNTEAMRVRQIWYSEADCDLEDFKTLIARETRHADCPRAAKIEKNIPIYECADVIRACESAEGRRSMLAELCTILAHGAGVIVFKHAFERTEIIDRATEVFERIIDEQKRTAKAAADHFAKPGANDRIWNSLEKHCLEAPENFAAYYGNPMIALASEAWLGPHYQMTAQVNRVNPGGSAQKAHRDYHLGFQSAAEIERYPAHVHHLSPVLTLQGAVAHNDMPLESGPTLFLPYSQLYSHGYLISARPEFQSFFDDHHVQLPLDKGDVVFFNPALIHAAGTNRSEGIYRMANLLQVSSAFGRAMESVNRNRMSKVLYPVLTTMLAEGTIDRAGAENAIAATAEGYSFPTNLDSDPPIGGLAPRTQAQIFRDGLAVGMAPGDFSAALDELAKRQQA